MKALVRRLLLRKPAANSADIVVEGARKATGGKARNRVLMTMAVFLSIYGALGDRSNRPGSES